MSTDNNNVSLPIPLNPEGESSLLVEEGYSSSIHDFGQFRLNTTGLSSIRVVVRDELEPPNLINIGD